MAPFTEPTVEPVGFEPTHPACKTGVLPSYHYGPTLPMTRLHSAAVAEGGHEPPTRGHEPQSLPSSPPPGSSREGFEPSSVWLTAICFNP